MIIFHWNISKKNYPEFATKKYEDELYNNLKKRNINVQRVFRQNSLLFGNTIISWPLYKGNGADIVHATFQSVAPAVFFKKPKRFIVTVHDLAPLIYDTIRDISFKIQWRLIPGALRKADRIIAISNFTKNEIIRLLNIDENKIDVVHQGVDHSKYKPMNKIESKQEFNLDVNDKHILIVSSNAPYKRMDLIKEILDRIQSQRSDVKILKIGYGEKLDIKGVINIGWLSEKEMPCLYNAADIYLHLSEYEGFGLPVLEAMACGLPVVAGNVASIPEILEDTVNFNGKDLDDLDSKIKLFADGILNKIDTGIDRKNLEKSQKFSWEITAKNTLKIYENVLSNIE